MVLYQFSRLMSAGDSHHGMKAAKTVNPNILNSQRRFQCKLSKQSIQKQMNQKDRTNSMNQINIYIVTKYISTTFLELKKKQKWWSIISGQSKTSLGHIAK